MNKETIFIVDDNEQVSNFLAEQLLPSLGYQTLVAHDGRTALEIARKRAISLMILDFQLPDTNGLDLMRQLSGEGRNIPTILVSAHGSEQIVAESFHLGVHDYLIKPFDADRLNAAITRALSETRLRREKALLDQQLKEQVSWLTVLSKVGRSMTSTLELDEVLRRIVEAGVHLTRADEGFLALLDDPNGQLYIRAVKNIDEEKSKTMHLPVNDSLVGEVLRNRRPIRTTRNAKDPLIKVSTGFLVHNLIHVPIFSKGNPLGVLSIVNHSSHSAFKEKDEAVLTSLADYAAVAIENASLYQQAQQEIEERKRIEENLRQSEERYALAVRGANDGLWDWDLKTNQIYFSPRWKAMLGFEDHEIENDPPEWFDRVHPEDIERLKLDISAHANKTTTHFENEHRMLHKDGTYRWMLSRGIAVWDANGSAARIAGSQTDITDRKYAEQKLLHDAFYDKLTGLPNRALFMDHLNYAIKRYKRRDDYLYAVLFLDLDRFKDVNDSLGHLMGDQLLVSISHTLESGLRATDTVARFGGDEFVLLLDDIRDIENATQIAEWIQNHLAMPFHLDEHDVFITTSIGIVISSSEYNRAEDVLRDADIAMYSAKAKGKACYEIFDPTMRDRILARLMLETDLRKAIDNQELRVHYQLIVSLETSRIVGFEALARWQHPQRGLLYPIEFIPLAEETGLITAIDRWVLHQACMQMRTWQTLAPMDPPLTISVNLSSKGIAQPDLIEYIEAVLEESALAPNSLRLEITESAIMQNDDITTMIFNQLQAIGVRIEIDDFGTGYSSLSYLSNFPISALKIDQSFVKRMSEDSNMKIIQAIVMLSHRLGVGVIAEGIENEGQMDQLKILGCEFGQGFFVSTPMDSELIKSYLTGAREGGDTLFSGILQELAATNESE